MPSFYAAIAPGDSKPLEDAVAREFPDHFKAAPGQLLISSNLTTEQVAEKLQTKGGTIGRVLLMRVTNYGGWHAQDLWEWFAKSRPEPEATATNG